MHDPQDRSDSRVDPLAEIVRAAGRREAPPQAHYEQVLSATHQVWRKKVESRRASRWLAIAASIAVMIGGGLLLYAIQPGDPGLAATVAVTSGNVQYQSPGSETWQVASTSGIELSSGSQIRTTGNGRVALNLSDGGSLRLDENSNIEFGNNAVALSSGRLYFDSDGRPRTKAIRIDTPIGIVRDIGTQFELSLRDDSLRIRVREGEVAVLDSLAATEVFASLGEEMELSASGQTSRNQFAPDDAAWGWAEELASVPDARAQTILTYLRWIARETGKRLEWESYGVELAAESASFNGDPEGLSPLRLLSSIAATSDFDYRLTDDGAIWIGRN